VKIRNIRAADNVAIKQILQADLAAADLAIPGTAYFDEGLDTLNAFYDARPDRLYLVVEDDAGRIVGGAGCAAYDEANGIAELQKLYLREDVRGHHLSYQLIQRVTDFARSVGYRQLYLETHHNLAAAVHIYQTLGFTALAGPLQVASHPTMDRFFLKAL